MSTSKKKKTPEKVPENVTLEKAAEMLKCTPQQFEQFVNDGRIEPITRGKFKGHFSQDSLLQLMAELDAERLGTPKDFPVVAIGASAGGLDAMKALLEELPSDLGMAYVFISHLNPDHESMLPDILGGSTRMPVHKVEHGMILRPDEVYVIPPNTTMYIVDGVLTLLEPRLRGDRGYNPINDFMLALSEAYQQNAIGVVLSGTASDGTLGLKAIRAGGGWTFAQDDSARFRDMPRNAREAGVVDFVLSPQEIAHRLVELRKHPVADLAGSHQPVVADEHDLHEIFVLLQRRFSVDFTQYKRSTINRRILRRVILQKNRDLMQYAALLRKDEKELSILFHDLLINVTSFFREPAFFKSLTDLVFPTLFKDRKLGQPFRIWVAGCSTGEESVSIAISLLENFGDLLTRNPVQIFSTDLDGEAVIQARQGIYKKAALENISATRLNQYFNRVDDGYQVIKPIREMCVFAQHDLLRDPPFSRMDLLSCQNVLIYLAGPAQQKVLRAFHYALQPSGFLALGHSETINSAADLFSQVDKESRIYSRKDTVQHIPLELKFRPQMNPPGAETPAISYDPPLRAGKEGKLDQEMDNMLLHRHIPASLLVTKDLEIVRFRGATAPYMAPHTGRASLNLLKMIREDLLFEVRTMIKRAKDERTAVLREGIELQINGSARRVSIEVVPMRVEQRNDHFLIVFRDEYQQLEHDRKNGEENTKNRDQRDLRIAQLEREIRELREQMRVVNDEAQSNYEELQTASEEVLSSNEELQSMNEELETSKEELQSANEELTTINDELQIRNTELKDARDYAQTIIGTLASPLVIVNANMRVHMANKAFYRMFQTNAEETEGMLIHELGDHQWEVAELRKKLFEVLSHNLEMRDFEVSRAFPQIGDRIIRLNARRIERNHPQHRILITMEDITDRRRAEETAERLAAIVASSDDAIVGLDLQGRISEWNHGATKLFGFTGEEVKGRTIDLLLPNDQLGRSQEIIRKLLEPVTHNYEAIRKHKDGHLIDVSVSSSPITLSNDRVLGISKIMRDITPRKQHERELQERDRMYQAIGNSINYGIFVCDADGNYLHTSESFLQLIGLTQEECSAMGWARALHPEDAQRTILSWRRSVKEGSLWASEHRFKSVNGEWHTVLARGVPYRDDAGELKGWVGINLDITEHKRTADALRRTEERFQMLADHMDQLAWISEPGGKVVWMNKRWEDLSGIPRDQLVDHFEEMIHPDHIHRVIGNIQAKQQRGEAWEDTFPLKDAQGRYDWFLARAVPLSNEQGQITNWFGTCTDITDRMNAEEELRKVDKSKDHFLATLAHELRNPLAPLRSGVEVLAFSSADESTVKTTCAIMERQIGHMVRLIDDLMDLGRISTGRLVLRQQPMELRKAVDVAIEALQPMMDRQKHEFSFDCTEEPLIVFGDTARITQVISNLLHNAAKYTDPGGRIELTVKREADQAMIAVKDSGTGIENNKLDQVFDMFSQIEQEQRSQRGGGLGIGLHIVKRLVHMHNGTIEVTSDGKSKGSTFVVRLPLTGKDDTIGIEIDNGAKKTTAISPKRVLVVDDDPDSPLMLSMLLRSFGCETRSASNGHEAIREAEIFSPDIILMDITMPEMDGFEACRAIRQQPWGEQIRIYALTGWGQEVDRQRTNHSGFNGHLVKPIDRIALEELLADVPKGPLE